MIKNALANAAGLIGVVLLFMGYACYILAFPTAIIYTIYLVGPAGVAFGMALWKGLILFTGMFAGGLISVGLTAYVALFSKAKY